ncbi:MAG: type II toxin-antitoxin system Phd/YefM family antitoxin [Lachnospiraceae bacterium]|nr:type II toxin-antitoxin system Phd/YefM family antitoxin [Lachnospiraceae bacterium]
MNIVPMRDLKDTVKIEKLCAESKEPVFVTKNGYGRLVVMDIEYYDKVMRQIDEANLINKGLEDYKAGKTKDGKESLNSIRGKYGI